MGQIKNIKLHIVTDIKVTSSQLSFTMIHVVKQQLQHFDFHLASSSPRRKTILDQVGLPFTITPSTFEENLDKTQFSHPKEYAMENARCKAVEVMERLGGVDEGGKPRVVIGTDTVVVVENEILEKPHTNENAYTMLSKLNRLKTHEVYSGVAIVRHDSHGHQTHQFYDVTQVEFGDNPDHVIRMYADSVEPLDKAGGYGIQDVGAT